MIELVIRSALAGLGASVYANTFPQGVTPVWPAVRFTVVDRDPDATICGTDDGDTDGLRVQFDFVAVSYEAGKNLREAAVALLVNTDPPCTRDGGRETFDTETKTHRFIEDYLFHPSSAIVGSP